MTMRVIFVGVDTRGSHVHALFPRWMAVLGIDARIESVDLPLGATRNRYRSLVESIASDPGVAGAVITSHKLALFAACQDLFAEIDPHAATAREASSLYRTPGGLGASARDVLAVREVVGEMEAASEEVLCLGAGGAATAIAIALVDSGTTPRRLVFTDVQPDRLRALAETLDRLDRAPAQLDLAPARANDRLLASLGPGSLVVNATGLGKDRPGSPIDEGALFPLDSVVWELNYRGDLPFLAQARRQQAERRLRVHDGHLYFLHGWFQALTPILGLDADAVAAFRTAS